MIAKIPAVSSEFLNPERVLDEIELKEDMISADFGCGSGGWAIPLAKRLKNGKVYAIDILEEPLSVLQSRILAEGISNIEIIRADLESKEGLKLKNSFIDLILMTNLLFQCQDKKKILQEGKRILKKGGKILVVDWQKTAPFGPKEGRILPEEVKEIGLDLNLRIDKEFLASPYHYAIILVK